MSVNWLKLGEVDTNRFILDWQYLMSNLKIFLLENREKCVCVCFKFTRYQFDLHLNLLYMSNTYVLL